jgi:hypothetical protein
MKLKTIEDTDRLNYRLPVSIKNELDELAERCKREKIDFIDAVTEGLRGVAKTLRQQLDKKAKRGAKTGASVAPESFINGATK